MVRPRNSVSRLFLLALALAPFLPVVAGDLAESYFTTYFAPASILTCGIWRMRTPEGEIRQFEPAAMGRLGFKSADGWTAKMTNGQIRVSSPRGSKPTVKICYENGVPVSVSVNGKSTRITRSGPVVYSDGPVAPYRWPDWWEEEFRTDLGLRSCDPKTWWTAGKRFTLWFIHPNQAGAFLAMLLALAAVPAFRARKRRWKVLCSALALLAFVGILYTQSRSALIAALVAVALVAVCRLKSCGWLTRRRIGIVVLAFAVLCAAAAAVFAGFSSVDRRTRRQSDSYRVMMCRAFPRMMCDAPWGWGWNRTGRAFSDWYCPEGHWFYRKNLVSDHLTTLADLGWLGGGAYLLVWLVGLLGLLKLAWKGGTSVPLAVWFALAVTASYNVIFSARTIFWVPLAALAPLAFDRRWIAWSFWIRPVSFGIVLTGVILGTILVIGLNTVYSPSISRVGKAVLVNGDRPRIWLVADSDVLGSLVMPREEIRGFYRVYPKAAAIGIVDDLDQLGRTDVRRLVLSGRHCGEFLRRHAADSFRKGIPPEIVFLSPGFSAAEVPPELRARAEVAVVTGEFAARYHADMVKPPEWATVVKGAERYVQRWMTYFVPTVGRGGGR